MFTRVIQRKRPRRPAFLLISAASVAALLISAVALAVNDDGSFNVEVESKDFSSGLVLLDGDAASGSVEYIGSSAANESSGTGTFDPFVRLQGSPTEKGYNTDGAVAFDTKTGRWTHAILASAIPIVNCVINEAGTTGQCWEIFVDINESNTAKYVSLNEVEVWFTTDPNLVGYVDPSGFPSGTATQVYDFTGEILIHDVNAGSGRGDLRYLIPVTSFTATDYFVLYSKWGTTTTEAPDGKTYGSEGGFEEWKVRKAPNLSILKTANPPGPVNAGGTIGFDITVSNTGAAGATNVVITDPLPASDGATTGTLNWSENPDNSNCTISGAVGSQVLNCTFATLASGASVTVHIQSATTAADCGIVSNTATLVGDGSSTATVTVVCADVTVQKTPDAETINAGTNAVFTVVVTNNGPTPALNVVLTDTLPNSGLSWTVGGADAAACSITTGVLTCNFGTVGYPTLNTRTITLTSATDSADCARPNGGRIDNTALVSSDSEGSAQTGNNSDTGDISVNCAAIQVLKQSTKTGNPLVTDPTPLVLTDNAVFTITPPVGTAFAVTDNSTGDEDSTYGEVCVSGLAPGTYTVTETTAPAGYASGNPGFDTSAVAEAGTNCSSSPPSTANSAIFRNPPLGEIEVIFRDLGSGETFSSIVCTLGTTTIDAEEENGEADPTFDDTDEVFTDLEPGTYTCTVVVDP